MKLEKRQRRAKIKALLNRLEKTSKAIKADVLMGVSKALSVDEFELKQAARRKAEADYGYRLMLSRIRRLKQLRVAESSIPDYLKLNDEKLDGAIIRLAAAKDRRNERNTPPHSHFRERQRRLSRSILIPCKIEDEEVTVL